MRELERPDQREYFSSQQTKTKRLAAFLPVSAFEVGVRWDRLPNMNENIFQTYDSKRKFDGKAFRSACYAPFASLYFDQFGFVRACCQNSQHSLGNLARSTIDEIWNGVRAKVLRDALRRYDFSLGCKFCQWEALEGDYAYAQLFDKLSVPSETEFWPKQMEFAVSNTCNLECVMCGGEWSSAIRSRREKLPPLPKVYADQFFVDLRKYLPHLESLKVLGGEPFVQQESFRIWNMLIEDSLRIPCHVTTNGTQFNAKVERVLENLPLSIAVSMDGATKATVETIRKNARYEEVIENFKRFHAYARRQGTGIDLTYCLMTINWHEFGEFLQFAEEWDCSVYVNTVIHPPKYSLSCITPEELRPIVEALESQTDKILPFLKRNRQVWTDQINRLRNRLMDRDRDLLRFISGRFYSGTSSKLAVVDVTNESMIREASSHLNEWCQGAEVSGLICDKDDNVLGLVDPDRGFLGIEHSQCVGRPVHEIFQILRFQFGTITGMDRRQVGEYVDRRIGYQDFDLVDRTIR